MPSHGARAQRGAALGPSGVAQTELYRLADLGQQHARSGRASVDGVPADLVHEAEQCGVEPPIFRVVRLPEQERVEVQRQVLPQVRDDEVHLFLPDHKAEHVAQARIDDSVGGVALVAVRSHAIQPPISVRQRDHNGALRQQPTTRRGQFGPAWVRRPPRGGH
jgi:hypothetical protein